MQRFVLLLVVVLAGCAGTSDPDAGEKGGLPLEGGIVNWRRAAEIPERRADSWFRIACAHAALGDTTEAFVALEAAKRAGYGDRAAIEAAPELAGLQGDERFELPVDRHIHVVHLDGGSQLTIGVRTPPNAYPASPHPFLLVPGDPKPDDPVCGLLWGEAAVQRGWIVVESAAFAGDDPAHVTGLLMDLLQSKFRVEGGKFHLAAVGDDADGMFRAAVRLAPRLHSVTAIDGPVPEAARSDVRWLRCPVNLFANGSDPERFAAALADRARMQALDVDVKLDVLPRSAADWLLGGELMDHLDAQHRARVE